MQALLAERERILHQGLLENSYEGTFVDLSSVIIHSNLFEQPSTEHIMIERTATNSGGMFARVYHLMCLAFVMLCFISFHIVEHYANGQSFAYPQVMETGFMKYSRE